MEERKQVGLAALIFLTLFSGLLYVTYRGVWREVEH
jgi:cytochrome c1